MPCLPVIRSLVLLLLILMCAACASGPGSLSTLEAVVPEASPTITPTRIKLPPTWTDVPTETPTLTPTPSATLTPSPTLVPSPTLTPPPTPVTWQLWFSGHTCMLADGTSVGECGPAWTVEGDSFFSIWSDGSELQDLGVASLPPTLTPYPGFLPPYKYYEVSVSPDGAHTAAVLDGKRLEVFPAGSEEPVLSFEPEWTTPGFGDKIDTLCWAADGSALRFIITQVDDWKRRESFGVITIRLDGSPPEIIYPPPGIDAAVRGVCSPDGAEAVFSNWSSDAGMSGLYKVNLYTGEAVPLLQGYFVGYLSMVPLR